MWGRTLQFLPNAKDREGLLPWVIGVMLFLCTLAVASAFAINSGVARWSSGLTSNITVQIIVADETARTQQTEAALRLLEATPGIVSAEILASSDVMALVSPWLGDLPLDAGLPVPNLIDVTLAPTSNINMQALGERLQATASGAVIDDHQAWLSQILDLAAMIQVIMTAVVFMVILSTIAIVIFGCRAGLATHADSIEIMHLMGAEDRVICHAFDLKYLKHGIKGGILGVFLAGITLWLTSSIAADLGEGLVSSVLPSDNGNLWLLLLPLAAAGLTTITARLTVYRALQDMM